MKLESQHLDGDAMEDHRGPSEARRYTVCRIMEIGIPILCGHTVAAPLSSWPPRVATKAMDGRSAFSYFDFLIHACYHYVQTPT